MSGTDADIMKQSLIGLAAMADGIMEMTQPSPAPDDSETLMDRWAVLMRAVTGCCAVAGTAEADLLTSASDTTPTVAGSPFVMFMLIVQVREGAALPAELLDTPVADITDTRFGFAAVDIDGSDDQFTATVSGQRIKLDPRAVPEWVREAIDRRTQGRQVITPTPMWLMADSAAPMTLAKSKTYCEVLASQTIVKELFEDDGFDRIRTGSQLVVELCPSSRVLAETSWKRAKSTVPPVQAVLPYDRVEGSPDELADMIWSRLGLFNTDCVLTFMAMMVQAYDGHPVLGPWTIVPNYSELMRLRNVTGAKARSRIDQQFQMLTQTEFQVSLKGADNLYVRSPYLQADLTIGIRGRGEVQAYRVHERLREIMAQQGMGIVWDRAICAADTRKHEWHVLLYRHLMTRMNRSWIKGKLSSQDGLVSRARFGTILYRTALMESVDAYMTKNGAPATRRRLRETLELLQRFPGQDGRPVQLIGDFEIEERGRDPLEDRLTIRPAPSTVRMINEFRSPAILAERRRAETQAAKPAKSGRQRPKRQRS